MKYILVSVFFTISAFAFEVIKPSAKIDQPVAMGDGIDYNQWETEFDTSLEKAKLKVKKCVSGSKKKKGCQFEKYQALDPSFDMIH
jgi:hypothetical protein